MDGRRRRSSTSITLVLIGASALSSCGPGSSGQDALRRDMYTSQADCAKDWGADPAKCQPAQQSSSRTGGGYTHYYGPAYRAGDYGSTRHSHAVGSTSAARPGSSAMGTTHVSPSSVSRSGFGSSSSSYRSSGSSASSSS